MSTIEPGSVAASTYRAMAESEAEYRVRCIRAEAQRDALLAAAKAACNEMHNAGFAASDIGRRKALNNLNQAIAKCEE